jgi:hypothetical protein
MSPTEQLKEIAADSARKASYWRRRFRFLGYANIGLAICWGPLGLFFVIFGPLVSRVLGLFLIALSFFSLCHAGDCFAEARNAHEKMMRLRQECLEAIEILEE